MPRRDTTTEAFEVLGDLTLTRKQAILKCARLIRSRNDASQNFIFWMGSKFRALKEDQRFESDQLSRWAGEGGYEP